MSGDKNKYILRFEETTIEGVPLVGGKNASIGEMYRELASKGVRKALKPYRQSAGGLFVLLVKLPASNYSRRFIRSYL